MRTRLVYLAAGEPVNRPWDIHQGNIYLQIIFKSFTEKRLNLWVGFIL